MEKGREKMMRKRMPFIQILMCSMIIFLFIGIVGCSKKENENLIFERPIDELFTLLNKDHYGLDKKSIYDCADIIRKGVKDLVNILFSNESWQRNIIPILDKYFEAMRKVTKGE